MPHPWQPARLRRANRVQEDRTHHGRSQAFTAPATSHPPIESIRRTQTEPPHPGQLPFVALKTNAGFDTYVSEAVSIIADAATRTYNGAGCGARRRPPPARRDNGRG